MVAEGRWLRGADGCRGEMVAGGIWLRGADGYGGAEMVAALRGGGEMVAKAGRWLWGRWSQGGDGCRGEVVAGDMVAGGDGWRGEMVAEGVRWLRGGDGWGGGDVCGGEMVARGRWLQGEDGCGG
jgi:hypothetical protein